MADQALSLLKTCWTLMRAIAVVSSSLAAVVSTTLPLIFYPFLSTGYLVVLFFLLTFGAFTIHGFLTHIFNDYADYKSGTDAYSPALLSGGSRVIQKGMISLHRMKQLGIGISSALLLIAAVSALLGRHEPALLLVVGVWAAASYSLSPLRLSYRPFLGEWLSLFPSILLLGLAAPWIALGELPVWGMQNALVNALFCVAWVMVHHIPDLEADKKADPVKRTSVVWFADTFGIYYARFPALLYFLLMALTAFWFAPERIWAAGGVAAASVFAVFLVLKMDVTNHEQVSAYEKLLLLAAMVTAVWIGIFV
jgi:1,4-dihydroxy-2-naphthoate polyprenyltransferase